MRTRGAGLLLFLVRPGRRGEVATFRRQFSSESSGDNERLSDAVLATLQKAQAFCFDVDSTVIKEEGIDELAKFVGVGPEVADLTAKAMEGNVPFQDALAARLNIIKPSQQSVARFLQERPFQLSDGIEAVVDLLHQHQKPVYLISGGFRQMIEPVAARLGIPQHRIFANRLLFDASGDFAGFDPDELTCRDGGKAKVAQHLISAHGFSPLVVVGDGATDLQARPPANVFIGYGGVVTREKVAQEADWFIRDFQTLLRALHH